MEISHILIPSKVQKLFNLNMTLRLKIIWTIDLIRESIRCGKKFFRSQDFTVNPEKSFFFEIIVSCESDNVIVSLHSKNQNMKYTFVDLYMCDLVGEKKSKLQIEDQDESKTRFHAINISEFGRSLKFDCYLSCYEKFYKRELSIYNLKETIFQENLSRLYKNKELLDFSIVFDSMKTSMKTKAHKLFLQSISPYFEAKDRFNSENDQHTTNELNLSNDPDVTQLIIEVFLDFVYSMKSISEMENIVYELWIFCDKFDFVDLKNYCEVILCNSINEKNIIEVLSFVENYSCEDLKFTALLYAHQHLKELKEIDEFNKLLKSKKFLKSLM